MQTIAYTLHFLEYLSPTGERNDIQAKFFNKKEIGATLKFRFLWRIANHIHSQSTRELPVWSKLSKIKVRSNLFSYTIFVPLTKTEKRKQNKNLPFQRHYKNENVIDQYDSLRSVVRELGNNTQVSKGHKRKMKQDWYLFSNEKKHWEHTKNSEKPLHTIVLVCPPFWKYRVLRCSSLWRPCYGQWHRPLFFILPKLAFNWTV